MKSALDSLRTAIGGELCDDFLGVLGGFTMGMVAGAVIGDVALGLDGALLGMAFLALGGIVVGVVVARHLECRAKAKGLSEAQEDAAPRLHGVFPAIGPEASTVPETRHLSMR